MLSAKIYSGWEALRALHDEHDRILHSCQKDVRGPDATCSALWATALSETLLRGSEVRTLVAFSGPNVVAIVPAVFGIARTLPFDRRELRVITEAYSGRCGLLVSNDDPAIVEFALERLLMDIPGWDAFFFSVIENSRGHAAVAQVAQRGALRIRCLAGNESPYIELGKSWDEVLSKLPKKMRWTIRKSERELGARGQLEYRNLGTPDDAAALLRDIFIIERKSWKEEAGTSITSQTDQREFFEKFVPLAANDGILCAHVLRFDGEPIAYILGIDAGDGVFLDLKESFDASFSEYSPAQVLKRFAIDALVARGIAVYDFMGQCEPYKMRWTSLTYRRLTLALFSNNLRGSLHYVRASLTRKAKPVAAVK